MKTKLPIIVVLMFALIFVAYADDEAANRPVVRSSEYGTAYAKSVPDESYGQKGKTRVFTVGRESDQLMCEYDWYANEIYLGGVGGATLIRFGPWHRGRKPQDDHLAIGVYRDGKIVREYSTVEMQKLGSGVSGSVSHYQVLGQRLGFRWLKGNSYVYEVKGISGKVFTFDLDTGTLVERTTEASPAGDVLKPPPPQESKPQPVKSWHAPFTDAPLWVTIFPRSPIRSLDDYDHTEMGTVLNPVEDGESPMEMEIRSASDQSRVGRFEIGTRSYDKIHGWSGSGHISQRVRRDIGALPEGDYLVALYLDGERCSNVGRFTIDSDFDPADAPVLEIVAIEPGPYRIRKRRGPVGKTEDFSSTEPHRPLGLRVVPPADEGVEIVLPDVFFPELVVDGEVRRVLSITYVGPSGPLNPNQRVETIVDLNNYAPAISESGEHEIRVRYLDYTSASITYPPQFEFAASWDAAEPVDELIAAFESELVFWKQGDIAKELIALGNPEVIPRIEKHLGTEDRRRRCNAALILANLGDKRGIAIIISELEDMQPRPTNMRRSNGRPYPEGQIRSDRYYAALLLGQLGDKEAVPALIQATKDKTIHYRAAISLGEIGDKSAIPALREMARDFPEERLWAGYALAALGEGEGFDMLTEISSSDPQWSERRHAVETLGKFGDSKAVPALLKALKDEHTNVRVCAARALGAIGDPAALPALTQALNDKEVTKFHRPTTVAKEARLAIAAIKD